ncbi:MAG: RNA repair transcriptional activator RtcR [Planctomycetota bacterium]
MISALTRIQAIAKPQVILGLLGPTLDRGGRGDRWARWRPTVSLCQHEDRVVDRLDLLFQAKFQKLADEVTADIATVSPETEVVHHGIEFDDAWDFEDVFGALYDFAAAYPFDPEAEDYGIHITTGTHVAQICLFLLTESRHMPGTLVQTSPPRRKDAQQPGDYKEIDLDLSRYDRIAQRFESEQQESLDVLKSGIATKDPAFNRIMEQIEHVAIHSRDPILLTGPTGAGKSQLARRIYELKHQRRQVEGPLVDVNCATIRGDTAMSALFGHRKGAFTGAATARPGLLKEADGGLLFLDEIGELRLDEQAMLLRAIEEKRFLPVGADREVASDFELICGTNRDLSREVAAGRFREDLLARINLWAFRLPGLAERRRDIEPNVQYELAQMAQRTGKRVRFNHEASERFMRFAVSPETRWAGNFRDLSAAIRRMTTLSTAGRIAVDQVDEEIQRLRDSWRRSTDPGATLDDPLDGLLDEDQRAEHDLFDLEQLRSVARVCRGSATLSDAGRRLFAVSRTQRRVVNDADRLRKYLARFGLRWSDVAGGR